MYGIKELKAKIQVDENHVECPINGCNVRVQRQRQVFKREDKFKCPAHRIYISPSTFEYESDFENMLWDDTDDIELFNSILKVKRESRIARDNSEDALTWNVFRYLDKFGHLPDFLSKLSGNPVEKTNLILWSYNRDEKSSWSFLNKARIEFGEIVARGSEPDIIVLTDKTLYFIEAKLSAKNETTPSNLLKRKKYETGGNNWFKEIFKTDYETVAIKEKRYELMRYWVLGSWIAKELNLDFEFYALVLKAREKEIERDFDKHIIETPKRKFLRLTWEMIFDFILANSILDERKDKIIGYFHNKTIGYNSDNLLISGFDVRP